MVKLTVLVLTIALAAGAAMGQAPTLRIVQTDGPDLPADLYYGNIKVKPLRLRPGTNQVITIDDSDFFVSEQYVDFLGRFPDQGGFDYWTNQITSCGSNAACVYSRRVGVSAAFFVEAEFQRTGSFVYRSFKGGLGRQPQYTEFGTDRRQVVEGPTLEQTKQAYSLAFVQRAEFVAKYNGQNTAEAFVDALINTISPVNLNRAALINAYNTGADQNSSRAKALRVAIDDPAFASAEYNKAFVLMQYFGYLRRDPDQGGYDFWLDVLNNREVNNYRGMVCAFITSVEYQQRFGNTVTQNDHGCGNINL
ncbi:MAG TPA: DUF4214 domain-containing protein [Pyrinomonadaceae bacterium]|nr:DUF4214 domain-containing protein [Pyrinomonadaceae bacterium]